MGATRPRPTGHGGAEGGRKRCPGVWAFREGGVLGESAGHEACPVTVRSAATDGRFQIEKPESMKEVVGEEGDEQKRLDGLGVGFIHMVGVPLVGEFVEPIVLNIPAPMPEADGLFGCCPG